MAANSPSPGPKRPFERLLDPHRHSVSSFYSAAEEDSNFGLDGPHGLSSWSEEMPQAILFPANKPSSRVDAAILDQWISTSFASYAQRCSSTTAESEEDLTRAVEELVPIVSIGLHEIVRQVSQHCLERGVVLEKIWRTYVDLFERALKEAKASLRKQKEKAARVEADLEQCREDLLRMRSKHPAQIAKLSKTLHGKFAQRQSVLEEQLRTLQAENSLLSGHYELSDKNAKCWFPLFDMYKASPLQGTLRQSPPVLPPSSSPEARISADMKRILLAMPPDGRRRVGFYISSLLGLRSTQLPSDTAEALTERRDQNRFKIEQLESRLAELKVSVGEDSTREASRGSRRLSQSSRRSSGVRAAAPEARAAAPKAPAGAAAGATPGDATATAGAVAAVGASDAGSAPPPQSHGDDGAGRPGSAAGGGAAAPPATAGEGAAPETALEPPALAPSMGPGEGG